MAQIISKLLSTTTKIKLITDLQYTMINNNNNNNKNIWNLWCMQIYTITSSSIENPDNFLAKVSEAC